MEQSRKPKWQLIYFALAAFDVLAITASLTLNHRIMVIYEESVLVNQEWTTRARDLSRLSELAQRTNAPGNDIFDSLDVAGERATRDEFLARFVELREEIADELSANVSGRNARSMLEELQQADAAMREMTGLADRIFALFENGQADLAGGMMATMDRSFAELNFAIGRAVEIVQDIQAGQLSRQVAIAASLKRFEFLIGGLIMVMVLFVTVYGHKIGRAMKAYEDRLQRSRDRANATAKKLAQRNKDLEATRRELEHISRHDFLSGLPNRRGLEDHLTRLDRNIDARSDLIAVLHIDLDRFKQINDTFGHGAGDDVIVSVAETIRNNCSDREFVARVGGDEFVVITNYGNRFEHPARLAQKIISDLRKPLPCLEREMRIGASIGIALQNSPKDTGKSLIAQADIALFRAKQLGRNRFEFFTESLRKQVADKQKTIDEIRLAIEQDRFVPYYQVQVAAGTFEVTGVEALARMIHPTQGVLLPVEFIDMAEEAGLLEDIDRIIMQRASEDFRKWQAKGVGIQHVSLNVSARRLVKSDIVEQCRQSSFGPGELSFELVETAFLDKPDGPISETIEALRAIDVGIEIDDFGTGHASILGILSIHPTRLKLDRMITHSINGSVAGTNLIRSLVEFGGSLGIEIVAEGVDTLEQADVLSELGCQYLQGYAFAKPVPAEELETLVASPEFRARLAS